LWHPFGLLHSPFCFATTISCLQVLEQQCPTCEPPAAQFKLSLLCVSNVMTTAPYMATFLDILMSMGIVFPIMTTFPLTFWCNEPLCYFFTSALRIEEIHVSTDWVQQNRFLFFWFLPLSFHWHWTDFFYTCCISAESAVSIKPTIVTVGEWFRDAKQVFSLHLGQESPNFFVRGPHKLLLNSPRAT